MKSIEEDLSIFDEIIIPDGVEYFFSLGSRYRHKNIEWIVNAARRNPQYYFVATGSDLFSNEIGHLESQKPSNMIFTGYISDGKMKALMRHCKALIQPSFYEGFGIPPLEALSLGRQIVVSKTSCLPEIYENCAHYIDPNNSCVSMDAVLRSPVEDSKKVLSKHT